MKLVSVFVTSNTFWLIFAELQCNLRVRPLRCLTRLQSPSSVTSLQDVWKFTWYLTLQGFRRAWYESHDACLAEETARSLPSKFPVLGATEFTSIRALESEYGILQIIQKFSAFLRDRFVPPMQQQTLFISGHELRNGDSNIHIAVSQGAFGEDSRFENMQGKADHGMVPRQSVQTARRSYLRALTRTFW